MQLRACIQIKVSRPRACPADSASEGQAAAALHPALTGPGPRLRPASTALRMPPSPSPPPPRSDRAQPTSLSARFRLSARLAVRMRRARDMRPRAWSWQSGENTASTLACTRKQDAAELSEDSFQKTEAKGRDLDEGSGALSELRGVMRDVASDPRASAQLLRPRVLGLGQESLPHTLLASPPTPSALANPLLANPHGTNTL
eukprot:186572-Rhodomonas_salina.3